MSFFEGFVEQTNVALDFLLVDLDHRLAKQLIKREFNQVFLSLSYFQNKPHMRPYDPLPSKSVAMFPSKAWLTQNLGKYRKTWKHPAEKDSLARPKMPASVH